MSVGAAAVKASNLIVVSNRLPWFLKRDPDTDTLVRKSSAGGLVTAVAPVVVKSGGLFCPGLKSSQVKCVDLSPEDYENYYNGCCNATFWPLFHSMPDRAVFNEKYWTAYK